MRRFIWKPGQHVDPQPPSPPRWSRRRSSRAKGGGGRRCRRRDLTGRNLSLDLIFPDPIFLGPIEFFIGGNFEIKSGKNKLLAKTLNKKVEGRKSFRLPQKSPGRRGRRRGRCRRARGRARGAAVKSHSCDTAPAASRRSRRGRSARGGGLGACRWWGSRVAVLWVVIGALVDHPRGSNPLEAKKLLVGWGYKRGGAGEGSNVNVFDCQTTIGVRRFQV